MAGTSNDLDGVLNGYRRLLRDKDLGLAQQ